MSAPPRPAAVKASYQLAALTTVRTGGPAQWFARAGSERELQELVVWARRTGARVQVLGSGSNLLVADEGVEGLVLKLDRELTRIEFHEDATVLAGGGARLPSLAAKAAGAGLSGIEFAVNIPGTVGGAVRMNANAYGGQLAQALQWVQVATPEGLERRLPRELGLGYRRSALREGEIVTSASFKLARADVAAVKAALVQMRKRRHDAQPQGIKTFGSTFKNPSGAQDPEGRSAGELLSLVGCNGLAVGGARFAPKHANFIENTGSASTADVVALMADGRARVLERFGVALEREVQTLGAVIFPWENSP
jgi:UDP-N-acetylenolpyruvoylglucosamine reductase